MPHSDPAVIAAAKQAGVFCVLGFATPTEAFAALAAGFRRRPIAGGAQGDVSGGGSAAAEAASATCLKAMRAVLRRCIVPCRFCRSFGLAITRQPWPPMRRGPKPAG